MISYELATQLKEAGFPFKDDSNEPGIGHIANLEARHPQKSYFTGLSLSELIEACGDKYVSVYRANLTGDNQWVAWIYTTDILELQLKGVGSTPEEAVANLWLELNKK